MSSYDYHRHQENSDRLWHEFNDNYNKGVNDPTRWDTAKEIQKNEELLAEMNAFVILFCFQLTLLSCLSLSTVG